MLSSRSQYKFCYWNDLQPSIKFITKLFLILAVIVDFVNEITVKANEIFLVRAALMNEYKMVINKAHGDPQLYSIGSKNFLV